MPMNQRGIRGLRLADRVLAVTVGEEQQALLQYRTNCFLVKRKCLCGADFHRGHERCAGLHGVIRLSREEQVARRKMRRELGLQPGWQLPRYDFLINIGQARRVAKVLLRIKRRLKQQHAYGKQESDVQE